MLSIDRFIMSQIVRFIVLSFVRLIVSSAVGFSLMTGLTCLQGGH